MAIYVDEARAIIRETLNASPEPLNARIDIMQELAKDLVEQAKADGESVTEIWGSNIGAAVQALLA